MKQFLTLIILSITAILSAQNALTIEGQSYSNSDDTWNGVNITRTQPTSLIFRNNSITSVNRYGYLLCAGDETPGPYNNNLDGAVITGNLLTWNGKPEHGIIPHGLFTGHNINVKVRYNYLNKVPMAIIRKSDGMTDISGVVAYNIIKDPGVGVVIKGMNGVKIYNNTFYSSLTTGETNRALIDIYENPSVTPAGSATGTKIFNNIFYTKHNIRNINISNECLPGFESDYNIFYCESGTPTFTVNGSKKTFAEWQAMGYDKHSVVINPGFKDLTTFAPSARLDYGTNLGSTHAEGLSVNAKWGKTSPETALQNGKWQVGAVIYKEVVVPDPPQAPVYAGAAIENATPSQIALTFSLSLANTVPATSAFDVRVNSAARSVTAVAVSGTRVTLTLASAVKYGETVTVAYNKPSANPLQTPQGGQAATFTAKNVTNNVAAPVPAFSSAIIENGSPTQIALTFSLSLANTVPATSAFDVRVNSAARSVTAVAVSGTRVTLTLSSAVKYGETVTVAYNRPTANPLQTPQGGQTATFTAKNVTNNVAAPVPAFSSAVIENATPSQIALTFSLSLANTVPATSAFDVRVNSAARSVTAVAVSGTRVTLTLASAVKYGETVTVAYNKPTANPLQTPQGGQAATFTAKNVTNNVAPPVPTNLSPLITIASPTKSEAFIAPALVTIEATASDPDGSVVKVEFYNGSTKLGEQTAAPWTFTWKEVPEGTYTITAAATDNSNARTVSGAVTVVVEKAAAAINLAPSVEISSPGRNTLFDALAEITLTAIASDPDGSIEKVEYFLGEIKIGESIIPPFTVTFTSDTAGSFEVRAIAWDNLNAYSSSEPVTITVKPRVQFGDLVSLYPTPNNGSFTIEFGPMPEVIDQIRLDILNMSGLIIWSDILDVGESLKMIDMGESAPGFYILRMFEGPKILTTKRFVRY